MSRDSRYQWDCRIVALCPLSVRVDAVYYWGEDPADVSVDRIPQVALALCEEVCVDAQTGREIQGAEVHKGILKYVDAEFPDSVEYFANEVNGPFLGYEYGGVTQTWANAIKAVWQGREKKRVKGNA